MCQTPCQAFLHSIPVLGTITPFYRKGNRRLQQRLTASVRALTQTMQSRFKTSAMLLKVLRFLHPFGTVM